jgi:hypothetical protein
MVCTAALSKAGMAWVMWRTCGAAKSRWLLVLGWEVSHISLLHTWLLMRASALELWAAMFYLCVSMCLVVVLGTK